MRGWWGRYNRHMTWSAGRQHRRLVRPEDERAEPASREPTSPRPRSPVAIPNSLGPLAHELLAVQRSAGNSAAGMLVARERLQRQAAGTDVAVAAEPAESATAAKAGQETGGGHGTMTVTGIDGTIPILHWSSVVPVGETTVKELAVVKETDETSPVFAKLFTQGTHIERVEIASAALTLKLGGVFISAVSPREDVESLTLNFASIKLEHHESES